MMGKGQVKRLNGGDSVGQARVVECLESVFATQPSHSSGGSRNWRGSLSVRATTNEELDLSGYYFSTPFELDHDAQKVGSTVLNRFSSGNKSSDKFISESLRDGGHKG